MASLAIIKTTENKQKWNELRKILSLEWHLLEDTEKLDDVKWIIKGVRSDAINETDGTLLDYTWAHDGVKLGLEDIRVKEEELKAAYGQMDKKLLESLRQSIANVRSYQEAIKVKQQDDWEKDGVRLGVRYRPIRRVGVCVPGAAAPLVSTVIMTVVPAQVAGVKEIAVISAPRYNKNIHPDILGLCWELKVKEVYRVSGTQGVAALAFGTKTIPKVDKIVGPSSWWGQLAKKELYGLVDIDSFAGPSEVLIIADDSAKAAWVAADMLSQAEHAPGSAVLLTDSEKLAEDVANEVERQLEYSGRAGETRKCVEEFCLAVVTKDMDEAVELANEFAAEHLQVQCRNCDEVAEKIVNAGAIFIGDFTPVATGDYYAGPSHVLPTGGSARFFSALNVNDFIKQSSIIKYNEKALKKAASDIMRIAQAEGLDGHGKSVRIRRD